MIRDPWPSPRPWHESITTNYKSWCVHDYCLLFSAIWNFGYGLCSTYTVSLVVFTAIVTRWTRWTVTFCTSPNHVSSVLWYWRDPRNPFTFVDQFDPWPIWPADPLSALGYIIIKASAWRLLKLTWTVSSTEFDAPVIRDRWRTVVAARKNCERRLVRCVVKCCLTTARGRQRNRPSVCQHIENIGLFRCRSLFFTCPTLCLLVRDLTREVPINKLDNWLIAVKVLPRCMEFRRGLAMRILSVCPSVCPSVCQTRELWQNGRKISPDFYIVRKNI